MLIDCNSCVMQDTDACDGCIVTVLLDELGTGANDRRRLTVNDHEIEALDNLANVGLVPPLKLVSKDPGNDDLAAEDDPIDGTGRSVDGGTKGGTGVPGSTETGGTRAS